MLGGANHMFEVAFGIVCFGIIALNIGYCIFDHE